MSYFPLVLGLAVTCGMVLYVEITLRRERLSGLRARQSIIDRRLLSMKSALERIERRLDAMTVDRELAVGVEGRTTPPSCNITVNGTVDKATIAKLLNDELAAGVGRGPHTTVPQAAISSPSRQPCLDCGLIGAHVANCALRMDNLVESPTDAAARRGCD